MRIRVITYNIHRAIGVDRRFRPQRIVDILRHYRPPVVLLQEVDEGAPRSRELDLAQELAEALQFPHYALGHNVSLRRGRYGNATLSRFPILRERNIDLSVAASWIRRGCQHTTIELDGGAAPGGVQPAPRPVGARARAAGRAAGQQRRSSAGWRPEVPSLVGGDFNDWRSLLRPIFTEVFGFRCATDRKTGSQRAIRTYPSFSPQGGSTASTTAARCASPPPTPAGSRCRAWRATTCRSSPTSRSPDGWSFP